MNTLEGIISNVDASGDLMLVEVRMMNDVLSAVILDSPGNSFTEGELVSLLFKETEVAIAIEYGGKISMKNKLACKIERIEKGKILTSVHLKYNTNTIVSIITTSSANNLELKVGLAVTAYIKTNEMMIMSTKEN